MGSGGKKKDVLSQVSDAVVSGVEDIGQGVGDVLAGGDKAKKAIENLGKNALGAVVAPVAGYLPTAAAIDIKNREGAASEIYRNVTGETAKEIASDQIAEAKRQEQARIRAEEQQKEKSRRQAGYGMARSRQKSIMGQGRGSTILTSGLGAGDVGAGSSGKTLLGQ